MLVPRRAAPAQQWAFWGTAGNARGSPSSGRPASACRPASARRRSTSNCHNSHASTAPGRMEGDVLEQTMKALQENAEEVSPKCCWCGLPSSPGHRESCALRPAPCRHCNQWLSLAALAPHEDVCPKGRAAQQEQHSNHTHSRHLLSRRGRTPAGSTFNPASSQTPCLVDDWGRAVVPAFNASDAESGSLPPLSSRAQAPLAKVPLPRHGENFARPPQRRASCQPPLHSRRRQLLPAPTVPQAPATARATKDQEEATAASAEAVPSVEELRMQVQAERRKYIQERLARGG